MCDVWLLGLCWTVNGFSLRRVLWKIGPGSKCYVFQIFLLFLELIAHNFKLGLKWLLCVWNIFVFYYRTAKGCTLKKKKERLQPHPNQIEQLKPTANTRACGAKSSLNKLASTYMLLIHTNTHVLRSFNHLLSCWMVTIFF